MEQQGRQQPLAVLLATKRQASEELGRGLEVHGSSVPRPGTDPSLAAAAASSSGPSA